MLVENMPIVERWSRAGGISMTRKSGPSGDFADASMMASGLRNSSIERICWFPSLSLKHVFSLATNEILGYSGDMRGEAQICEI
jgi:hypothetical protein